MQELKKHMHWLHNKQSRCRIQSSIYLILPTSYCNILFKIAFCVQIVFNSDSSFYYRSFVKIKKNLEVSEKSLKVFDKLNQYKWFFYIFSVPKLCSILHDLSFTFTFYVLFCWFYDYPICTFLSWSLMYKWNSNN